MNDCIHSFRMNLTNVFFLVPSLNDEMMNIIITLLLLLSLAGASRLQITSLRWLIRSASLSGSTVRS